MKTRETIEAIASSGNKPQPKAELTGRARSNANLCAPWTSETAPRNGGRPKKDMSQEIAKQVFENNPELIYRAFVKALSKGGAFAYQVLSDRAYGKLKETREIGNEYNEIPDDQIQAEIERICEHLGLAREADAAAEVGVSTARAEKANGKAKTTDVLS